MIIDVRWYVPDAQYLATTLEYPSLSWLADTAQEASEGLRILIDDARRDILNEELHAAVDELVTAVEATARVRRGDPSELAAELERNEWLIRDAELAWSPDVHGETDDVHTIEQAADRIEQKLRG